MEVLEDMVISESPEKSKPKRTLKRKNGKVVRTSQEEAKIKELFTENKKLYERAKTRGRATQEELIRHKEIKDELKELRAI